MYWSYLLKPKVIVRVECAGTVTVAEYVAYIVSDVSIVTLPDASALALANTQKPASTPTVMVPVKDLDDVCCAPTWTVIDAWLPDLLMAVAESTATKWLLTSVRVYASPVSHGMYANAAGAITTEPADSRVMTTSPVNAVRMRIPASPRVDHQGGDRPAWN